MTRKLCKRLMMMVACMALTISVRAATEIVVYQAVDNTILFRGLLEDEPILNFTETGLEIKSSTMETLLSSTEFTSIGQIVFNENVDPSGISLPEAAQQGLTFQLTDANTVIIGGLMPEQQVSVLALSGQAVSSRSITRNNGIVNIDLSTLSRGYYIINVGKQSFKVFKK